MAWLRRERRTARLHRPCVLTKVGIIFEQAARRVAAFLSSDGIFFLSYNYSRIANHRFTIAGDVA